ncbi:MAG: 4-aminobutyrate--2-oxoglutarate transaminase [Armatimonadota bacterium]|nr:4-aminobutyrate--2-oxoglutarate transaminase [Armatimonadota bacterium]MDR7439342.1 4-aminobutyrate--2-oxoglutarate transaminase [Armatimonadota bacterium]MDR7562032.1 4-aminobutyrate--2-oxoglutarate transaminase [Armatimonadota bacterium]MDR7566994.1 4-aminobutyrate--2-oxoglutarate transaminase [Armatimonadota bacterium]MDR7601141.1 4-aminobutyrate--2-oxoglutarate transaminase [Armatimonadota bacterium]
MPHASVRSPLPGPQSAVVLERARQVTPRAVAWHHPVVAARGEGAVVYDVDGNRFLDLTGGVGCLAVGHAHPKVVRAIQEQAARFTHTDYAVVPYEVYVALCERLVNLAPGVHPKKAALFNSGAEAVENAVKLARAYTRRPALIAFEGAFHGRTYMALTLTSKVEPYKRDFGPFVPEVYRVPYPYPYRSPFPTPEQTAAYCLQRLEEAFALHVQPDRVAAVVVEPVLGEGGFVVPPPEFLPRLAQICRAHGILLIVDEIQTGFGRTGRLWAVEHFGVEPDLLVVGKSIAAGLPLSAVIGRAEILDCVPEGGIGGTYVGNPLSCAAALAVMEVLEEERLVERAVWVGNHLLRAFRDLQSRFAFIGDVRGLGAMVAMELVGDPRTKEPAPHLVTRVIHRAREQGVLLLRAGIYGNVIRVLVPLMIPETQLLEAMERIARAVEEVGRPLPEEAGG